MDTQYKDPAKCYTPFNDKNNCCNGKNTVTVVRQKNAVTGALKLKTVNLFFNILKPGSLLFEKPQGRGKKKYCDFFEEFSIVKGKGIEHCTYIYSCIELTGKYTHTFLCCMASVCTVMI